MDVSELVSRLQQYGLDESESAVYYNLCRLGPSRAAAVAEAAGRKRTDVYRILDQLVTKNFAQKTLERPTRYVPRPVEEALERAMAERRGMTEVLESQKEALVQSWPRPLSTPAATKSRFAVHQGSTQVMGLLVRMMESAKEDIVYATSPDGLARLDAAVITAALTSCASRGISVRVLAKRVHDGVQAFPAMPGVRVRYADLPTFYQALIVDEREVGLFVSAGKGISGAEETVLCLTSSDVVLAQKALFDQAWSQALSPAQLEAEGMPKQVQVLRGRWVRGARLREMISTATKSILIQVSPEEAAGWASHGIERLLNKRASDGLQIVLRFTSGKPPLKVLGAVVEPPEGDPRCLVAIIDGVQSLLGLGVSTTSDPAATEDEWCIWSTHPDLVSVLGPAWSPAQVRFRLFVCHGQTLYQVRFRVTVIWRAVSAAPDATP